MKYTAEMAMEQEKQGLLDAVCGNGIELNNEFLNRFAGDKVKEQLLRLPERDRSFYLDYSIDDDKCFFNGSPASNCDNDIWLNVVEIEVQFDGKPEEFFENVDDWYISEGSDLAYYYVGYGLTVEVDVDNLKEDIDEALN